MPSNNDATVEMSTSMRRRGFLPGQTVHECVPKFTLQDLKEALFGSTYRDPKPLLVEAHSGGLKLQVVVTAVEQVYFPVAERTSDLPVGCYNDPEWKVEGWLLKSGFDPYDEVVRVKMFVDTNDHGFDMAYLQRVPDPGSET